MISVLFIDDEPYVLEITRHFFDGEKEITVDECTSIKDALVRLKSKIYDVIVADYAMPDLKGIDLLKTLKIQDIDIPVIIFSKKSKEDVVTEKLFNGTAFYFDKGTETQFQFIKLKKMIHEAALKKQKEKIYREKNICVVIPAYNEEKHIGLTLDSVPYYIKRIYAVDDASYDRTPEIIRDYAGRDSRIEHIRHDNNKGVGAAIVSGYREALKEGMDIAVVMAGDNQMDPAYLPNLVDPIINEQADYTIGNRLLGPEYRKGMTRWRFFGNISLTLLTKIASGYWHILDTQNGYTAISRKVLERIDLTSIYPRYGYLNDILVKLNVFGFRVKNAPHPARYADEKSGIRYRTYIARLSWLLFKNFLWRMEAKYIIINFHPLVFFYFFGIVITVISILGGIYAIYGKLVLTHSLFVPAALSLLLLIMGMMFVFFAMLFDMEQNRGIG